MIKIDSEKCVGCLQCTRVCIWTILEARDGWPVVLEDKAAGCAKCMHCGIVCPEGAITFGDSPMMIAEEKPVVSDTFGEDLESFLLTRRSSRGFREEPVGLLRLYREADKPPFSERDMFVLEQLHKHFAYRLVYEAKNNL